jgi:UDPglucose--hexose-1-phosphate uridylyltransferase
MNIEYPHRRYNPLTGEWVLVSPHRARRPWLGQIEKVSPENLPAYDPHCYLCPRNSRSGGAQNPDYASTFIFDNDFPALLPELDENETMTSSTNSAIYRTEQEIGRCEVICFSPRHDLTLPELPLQQVEAVVRAWSDQTRELGGLPGIRYVQVFENKGAMMGCSNPHPHSQIWASSYLPNEPAKELFHLAAYQHEHGGCLLCDMLAEEAKTGERIVAANDDFTALIPFWAVWPFEVMLVAHRHVASLMELTAAETVSLADMLRQVTVRYDNLFEISFPYSMGFHQAPVIHPAEQSWHLHAHFYPPLLRSATVRKFMVGYEMLANPQRDLTPETAADKLRSVSAVHYKQGVTNGK